MIRTIIFDLGKVLVPFDFRRGYERMASLCSYPAEEIPNRLRTTDLVTRFETGQIESRDFVKQLSELLGLQAGFDEFCNIWSCIFLPEPLFSDEFLQALRRNYRLVLLSNTNAIHFDMIRREYPIVRNFDACVLSYRVGAMKPQPEIYKEAIRQAACAPEECFFTDDIAAYVEGARQHGIDAVQFESPAQIERELELRGVRW